MRGSFVQTAATQTLTIHHPGLLTAVSLETEKGWEVCVYRSVLVKDTDAIYTPVLAALQGAQLTHRYEHADDNMIFGRGELSWYKLP